MVLPALWGRNIISTVMPSQASPAYIDKKLDALKLNSKAVVGDVTMYKANSTEKSQHRSKS